MKRIKNYENYQVCENGFVYRRGKKLKFEKIKTGYLRVKLYKNGLGKKFLVHRLVAQEYVKNPQNKPFVNHLDFNKSNNSASNLEWVTNTENIRHSFNFGLRNISKGSSIGTSVLTEDNIKEIRSRYKKRKITARMLSSEFGVSTTTIYKIIHKLAWKHI